MDMPSKWKNRDAWNLLMPLNRYVLTRARSEGVPRPWVSSRYRWADFWINVAKTAQDMQTTILPNHMTLTMTANTLCLNG